MAGSDRQHPLDAYLAREVWVSHADVLKLRLMVLSVQRQLFSGWHG